MGTRRHLRFDAASDSRRKPRRDLHRGQHQQGITWHEEHAGRRCRAGAIDAVENAVAQDAVPVKIVGDSAVERLIEVSEIPQRLAGNRSHKDYECQGRKQYG